MPNGMEMRSPKHHLLVTDEENPKVTMRLRPGMRVEVVEVQLVDTDLATHKAIAARLCGGTTTCLAVVDVS